MAKLTHAQKDALLTDLENQVEDLTARLGAMTHERNVALAKLRPIDTARAPAPTFKRQPFYTAFTRDHAVSACKQAAAVRKHSVSFKPVNSPRGIVFAVF